LFNLGGEPRPLPAAVRGGGELLFSSASARYGGGRTRDHAVDILLPHECLVLGARQSPEY
jgi:hypothetical protein